ncbi:MAG: Gfo/Idh/MocA family oxidoreductase [Acidimicrobiales bacterium]|jgi:predicted dehydrogenase|nr:Gfo/Idh/MocA family oxidoreductase [Acidimicrobiales bacterium]
MSPPVPTLAIVGTGGAASVHADAAAAAGIPVTALVGRRRRSGRELSEATGAPLVRLEDLPGRADVVLVATDPPSHAELAGRILDLGLPVLVERPLAGSPSEAAALAGRGAVAAENLRHAPLVRSVLERGGTAVDVEVRIRRPRPGWGFWPGTPALPGLLIDLLVPAATLAIDALALGSDAPTGLTDAVLLASAPDADTVQVDLRVAGRRARIGVAWTTAPLVDLQVAGDGFVSRAELLPHPGLELDGEPRTPPKDHATEEPLVALGYVGQLRTVLPALVTAPQGTPTVDRMGVAVVTLLAATLQSIDTGAVVALADVPPDRSLLPRMR